MPLNRIRGKANELLELQTRLRKLELSPLEATPDEVSEVAFAINELDEELGDWTETVPDEWYCQVMPFEKETMKSDEIRTDYALIYSSIMVGTFWNSYRAVRIYAAELLERCVRLSRIVSPSSKDLVFAEKPCAEDLAEKLLCNFLHRSRLMSSSI